MLEVKELVKMSVEDLNEQNDKISKEIYALRNELRVSRKLDKPHMLSSLKKDRARVLTALTQKNYNLNQR